MKQSFISTTLYKSLLLFIPFVSCSLTFAESKQPNVFIAISDDQSWVDASAYGSTMAITPHFDRVAKEGVLFTQAFCPSPGCSPSRAAFLTGLNTWQIEHAGTHASYFHPKYKTFPDLLAADGYFVGFTGKGWGPGNWKKMGRKISPTGKDYRGNKAKKELSMNASAFKKFMEQRDESKPFCFWFGGKDPHRPYKKGSGLAKGKKTKDAVVPKFLPDTEEIRSDYLDYSFEVERFDDDLGMMLKMMEDAGELDNTIVIVTSDNGAPFPRAKANCYEYGIHMPLAIRWAANVKGGRTVDDLIGFTDITATIFDVTGVKPSGKFPLVGKSIRKILESGKSGIVEPSREAVYSARERHSSSRFNSLSYPQRCIRTHDYLLIRNYKPERWPAGPAQKYDKAVYDANNQFVSGKLGPPHGGYHDIDACPTLDYLIENRDDKTIGPFLELAVGKRPGFELFDIKKDPECLNNLAKNHEYIEVLIRLRRQLEDYLRKTGDLRVNLEGDVWETYPRVSGLRWFPKPEWAKTAKSLPQQDWVDEKRPRK